MSEDKYAELVRLVSRLHAYGGMSHTPFCAKFSFSRDATDGTLTAFPCDCGIEAIFEHITVKPSGDT